MNQLQVSTVSTIQSRGSHVWSKYLQAFVGLHVFVRISSLGIPASVLALALLLRMLQLEPTGWAPDSYERLDSAQRLLAGESPLSRVYPPGPTLILAPVLLFMPDNVTTIQMMAVVAGLLLVILGYFVGLRLGGSVFVAAFVSITLAADPYLVFHSRVAMFDVLSALLLCSLVFLVPSLRGRGLFVFVFFGLGASLLVNIRPTNISCLPALLTYWVFLGQPTPNLRSTLRAAATPEVIAVGASFISFSAGLAILGGWLGQAAQGGYGAGAAGLSWDTFLGNLVLYLRFSIIGVPGLLLLGPPALIGLRRLWITERGLAVAIGTILVLWPVVHSPFGFFDERYLLSSRVFLYLLVGLGIHQCWFSIRPKVMLRRAYVLLGLAALGAYMLASSVFIISKGPETAAKSDEGMVADVAPAIRLVPEHSLIVSGVARVLERNLPQVEFEALDLLTVANAGQSTEENISLLTNSVTRALSQGRSVYYLRTQWEEDVAGWGNYYRQYFDGLAAEFSVRQVTRSSRENSNGFYWVLFEVRDQDALHTAR